MRATFTVAVALFLGVLASACSRQGQENLGLQATPSTWSVDVSQLTRPGELVHAAAMPARELDKKLGAHRFVASSSMKIEAPGKAPEALDESYAIDADGRGAFHVTHDNSRGYGYEAELVGGELFVKTRSGKLVKRKPEDDEADRLRGAVEGVAADYLKLFERWITVREDGRTQLAGRSAIKLKLAATASPAPAGSALEASKQWRRSMNVRYIDGDAWIDAATGALLSLKLDSAYSFSREENGQKSGPFSVVLAFRQTPAAPEAIEVPTDAIDSPQRTRPMLDRSELLEGLK
jgi:hypothetical protein